MEDQAQGRVVVSTLAGLQDAMAYLDIVLPPASSNLAAFVVKRRLDICIRMDADRNHQLPHVHVDYGPQRHAASFAIETGERLAGTLDRKYDALVRDWIVATKAPLLSIWHTTRDGGDPRPFLAALKGEAW
jgi:hypothetical protein